MTNSFKDMEEITMSRQQSNLSLQQYGYDLVVSTTQESINSTMKKMLLNFEGKEFTSCYISEEQSDGTYKDVPGDYNKLCTIAGMDLFDIPTTNQTPDQKDAADKAYDNFISFAFKATMGSPSFSPELIPDVIVLDQGSVAVTYNLFFKDFKILNVEPQRRGYSWTNISQADQKTPWVFKFTVKLDLCSSDSAFSHLPEDIQRKVKNLNPDSAFSVQQLYLDLNTVGLESAPSIVGLKPTSTAYIYLERVFINSYFEALRKNQKEDPLSPDDGILLGYSIKPIKPSTTSPSIIPTDLTFMISPFRNAKGLPTKDYDLYTLNYLVMSQNNHMPVPVEFGWNWIEESERSKYNGTMTIKKGIFVSFLNKIFSQSLNSICLKPRCSIHVNLVEINWTWGYSKETIPQTYQLVNDNSDPSRVLTFSYSSSASDSDTFVPNWGNISLATNIKSDVYLDDNIIKIVTTAIANVHINVEGGVTEGNFVKYTTETLFKIGVESAGNLSVTLAPGSPKFIDSSDPIDPNDWSQFVTFGQIDELVSHIKDKWTDLKVYLIKKDMLILSALTGSGVWVFPGGNTFEFKDICFSDNLDLVAHIAYRDPNSFSTFIKEPISKPILVPLPEIPKIPSAYK